MNAFWVTCVSTSCADPDRAWDYLRLVISTPFYQLVLAFAAVRALVKFNRQDFRWEKTSHSGAHLDYVQPIAQAVSA